MTRPSDTAAAHRGFSIEAAGRPFGAAPIVAGVVVVVSFLAALATWSVLAPIESAVVAPGVVNVDSARKTVAHLEGGIVKEIRIREGDRVAAGEVLLRLEDAQWVSERNRLRAQYIEARAAEGRLLSERAGHAGIAFSSELLAQEAQPTVRAALRDQRGIFASRRLLLEDQLAVLGQRVAGFGDEMAGLNGQLASIRKQMALVGEELGGVSKLYAGKLIDRPRVLALQRTQAEMEGTASELEAMIARAKQGEAESRLRMAELRAAAMKEVDEELRATRTRAYGLEQQLAAAQDVLRRTEIVSPIDGTVVALAVHTVGGVVTGGQPLLEIVPSNDDLVVDATVDPLDIDLIHVGLPAQVQLTAFNRRARSPIPGRVTSISADRLVDPYSGAAYYRARIELDADSPQLKTVALQPGMSADVMIRTGARTPLEYLLAPITRSLHRSLREQ